MQQTDSRRPIQNPSPERRIESEYDGKCMDVEVENNWCLVLVRFLENKRV